MLFLYSSSYILSALSSEMFLDLGRGGQMCTHTPVDIWLKFLGDHMYIGLSFVT